MYVDIRTTIVNTTSKDGKRARPVRLSFISDHGFVLRSPGDKVTLPYHVESYTKAFGKRGKGRVSTRVIKEYVNSGDIELHHDVLVGDVWFNLDNMVIPVLGTQVEQLAVKEETEVVEIKAPVPEIESEITEPEVVEIKAPVPEIESEITEPEVVEQEVIENETSEPEIAESQIIDETDVAEVEDVLGDPVTKVAVDSQEELLEDNTSGEGDEPEPSFVDMNDPDTMNG